MLNELCQLSDSLKRAGITPVDWHKDLKTLPKVGKKTPCFKIALGLDAEIVEVTTINSELAGILRKWEKNNGDSFPGFNIPPLYRVVDEEKKKLLQRWRDGKLQFDLEKIKSWCTEENRNWDQQTDDKLKKCLVSVPSAFSELLSNSVHTSDAFAKLMSRAPKLKMLAALETYLWGHVADNASMLLPLLLHEGNPKISAKKDRGSLSVFLDVQDWEKHSVASRETMQVVNECLLQCGEDDSVAAGESDAYGSNCGKNSEMLPQVRLRILGDVKLRSMFSASRCQYRYGAIESASFPVGPKSRKRAKGALEWLGDPSREGQTWGRADGKELIFAYPADVPPSPPKLAACLGARKAEDKSARFADYAKDVIGQLKGIQTDLKRIELRVFSLRKMDKARTKVVFHRNYTAEMLAIAANDWQAGCSNIPAIRISAWGDKKGEFMTVNPKTPFPLQIAGCLNQVWKMDGHLASEVVVASPTLGIELFLDAKDQRYISRVLGIAIQNGKGLCISLGNAIHRGERIKLKELEDGKVQMSPAILGLLLYKSGIRKDDYIMNAPYLIGNILKVSDDLHGVYCKEVRGGKLPPQLLGNALMISALECPVQALSQLALRIAPYLGWARTNSTDAAGLSRYFMKCYGEIESKLRGQSLPSRLNDAERAQLLLGYLASSEKSESNKEKGEE